MGRPATALRIVAVVGWTRSQRIRTAAVVPLEVMLVNENELPLYQPIAERAKHLHDLGMSYRAIGRTLGADYKVAIRAVRS